jgi:hypothetical protein
VSDQPTAEQYQRAYERVVTWPEMAGGPFVRIVGAVIDTGGFNMELNPFSLATLRVFLGSEHAAQLTRAVEAEELNTRWDDSCTPGGYVCATCGVPVESEPCPDHGPKLGTERQCTYCDGTGQVEFCDDVCQCGPTRCNTCDGTGVLS